MVDVDDRWLTNGTEMPKKRKKRRKTKRKAPAKPSHLTTLLLRPSARLGRVIGGEPCTRGDAVKKLWIYAKEHSLNEGRTIRSDRKMLEAFGVREVGMFDIPKLLAGHLTSVASSDGAAASSAAQRDPMGGAKPQVIGSGGNGRREIKGPVVVSSLLTAVLCGGGASSALANGLRRLTLPSIGSVFSRMHNYISANKLRGAFLFSQRHWTQLHGMFAY